MKNGTRRGRDSLFSGPRAQVPENADSGERGLEDPCVDLGGLRASPTLTDGGLGIALLWPFSNARYFAPWTPIPVAPIGARMVSRSGLRVVLTEAFQFAPLLVWAVWSRPVRRDS